MMINEFTSVVVADENCSKVLDDPNYFLHIIDVQRAAFGFLASSRTLLSNASFLDGRSPLSNEPVLYYVSIEAALDWHGNKPVINASNRFIFHMSFCGSTLLARVFDKSGEAFSYKEPQILVELAELKKNRAESVNNQLHWEKLIGFVLTQFSLPFSPGECNLIKPSNWVNSMLPDMLAVDNAKVVFLGITPEDFLTAVFRGGADRIKYVYSFLQHMQKTTLSSTHLFLGLRPVH